MLCLTISNVRWLRGGLYMNKEDNLRPSQKPFGPEQLATTPALMISCPLGEMEVDLAPSSLTSAELVFNTQHGIPAWQRDTASDPSPLHGALLERQTILNASTLLDRTCIIFDGSGQIVGGSLGWMHKIRDIPTLSMKGTMLAPISIQSQQEFSVALQLLFANCTLSSVPVALRDLDGWVTEVLHIKRVGPANPGSAFAILPKSAAEVGANIASLAKILRLTSFETELVAGVLKGNNDAEIAQLLDRKPSEIKQGFRQLIVKFKVRRKSDIVRLLASF